MKKMISAVMAAVMLFSIASSVNLTAFAATSGVWEYEINTDGTASISAYNGSGGDVTIPSSLNGVTVTAIYYDAFKGCSNVNYITIPSTIKTMGEGVFLECTNLKSIYVDNGNQNYSSMDGVLFSKDKRKLIQHPAGNSRSSYTVPDSVTSLEKYTFTNCHNLMNISLHDGIYIPSCKAFYYSGYYEDNRNWDGDALYIDNYFIELLRADGDFYVKEGTKSIAGCAFETLKLLSSVHLPDGLTTIGEYAFRKCTGLESVRIPDSTTQLGIGAFNACSSMEYITLPNKLTNIGLGAFAYCSALKSIALPNQLTEIPPMMFMGCESLTDVNIPKSVTVINPFAFDSCVL